MTNMSPRTGFGPPDPPTPESESSTKHRPETHRAAPKNCHKEYFVPRKIQVRMMTQTTVQQSRIVTLVIDENCVPRVKTPLTISSSIPSLPANPPADSPSPPSPPTTTTSPEKPAAEPRHRCIPAIPSSISLGYLPIQSSRVSKSYCFSVKCLPKFSIHIHQCRGS
ncbi:hypothetical protein LXL04_014831 [Taraxacum kok-saghyz]